MSPIGIIGIVVALAIFLYGAYKNVSVLYLAPLCGIIVAVTNVLTITTFDFVNGELVTTPVSITEAFTALHVGTVDYADQGGKISGSIGGVIGMISAVFPTIFLGALFGKVLTACGAAGSIATTLVAKLVMTTKDQMKQDQARGPVHAAHRGRDDLRRRGRLRHRVRHLPHRHDHGGQGGHPPPHDPGPAGAELRC